MAINKLKIKVGVEKQR